MTDPPAGAVVVARLLQGDDPDEEEQAPSLPGTYHATDMGNAQRFADQHGERVYYCYPLDVWYAWDGTRWQPDASGEIERLAKDVVRAMYTRAGQVIDDALRKDLAKWALRSESANKVKSMITLARSECPILPDQFNADPWLLNVRNGTVDLRTGELRPHRRSDLITQLAPINYDPEARLGLWDSFLADVTGGDLELASWLQRAVGYTLTGKTDAEVLYFIHGPGRSGKSTFLEAIKSALGDYSRTADFGAFLRGHTVGKPRADIARLHGARLVVSIEVDEGQQLAEAIVKMITGGDTIAARALYKDSFEFRPAFKLWLAANAAPRVSYRDSAIWERILRIPFVREIPREKRDPTIKERLRDPEIGGPAVLAWAVQGCLAWQREGLGTCEAVQRSTKTYREEMDATSGFFAECCVIESGLWVSAKELRTSYEEWSKDQGLDTLLSGREWGERLRECGGTRKLQRKADKVVRGWAGIGLLSEPQQEAFA